MGVAVDLFDDNNLSHPYDTYRTLRELGDVVFVDTIQTWVAPRYSSVREVLVRNDVFSSAEGVGFDAELNRLRQGTVLASDPPDHTRLRKVLSGQLGPRHLGRYAEDIQLRADQLVDEALGWGAFDGARDFAARFPLSIVADLIGLPQEGRDKLLGWAAGAFDTFGPRNPRTERGLGGFQAIWEYVRASMSRETLRPGSMGMAVLEAVDRGEIAEDESARLLSAYLIAGMDTTINSISNALWLFGSHPEQWDQFRAGAVSAPDAFNEVIRYESPVYAFSRGALQDFNFESATVLAGTRVAVLYGSANRDPAKWGDPDVFRIDRRPSDHVGFGYGIHSCAGQGLARVEGHAILTSLAAKVRRIEVGEPTRRLNNIIRGIDTLPVAFVPV